MTRWFTRDDVLDQLEDSDGDVSSDDESIYHGEGIVGYLPKATSFVLDAGEHSGAGAMDPYGTDDSAMVQDDGRLGEDSLPGYNRSSSSIYSPVESHIKGNFTVVIPIQ